MILHINIHSLYKNVEKLEILFSSFANKPHIIAFSETWKLECLSFYKLNDYALYYDESKLNQADGVVMFIKKTTQTQNQSQISS